METNLIDVLKDTIGGRITRDGEDYLQLSSETIDSALDYIFPALLGKLINKVQNAEDAEDLSAFLDEQGYDGSILKWLEDAFSGGPLTSYILDVGKKASEFLIEDKEERYLETISEFTQVPPKKIAQLTSLVAPLLLSQMQKVIKERNFTPANIYKYLSEQKDIAIRQTPSKLFDKLDLQKMLTKKEENKEKSSLPENENEETSETKENTPILSKVILGMVPAILILVFLIIAFLYVQQYDEKIERELKEIASDGADEEIFGGQPILSWGLPNGTEVTATENSTLGKLMSYLYGTLSDNKIPEKTFSITQDIIEEKTDTLRQNSALFTSKLAIIMKAYPELAIKFNIYIPQHLAQTKTRIGNLLKSQLVTHGIEGDRVTWQAGPKQTIGGGDSYKIELIARLPDKNENEKLNK